MMKLFDCGQYSKQAMIIGASLCCISLGACTHFDRKQFDRDVNHAYQNPSDTTRVVAMTGEEVAESHSSHSMISEAVIVLPPEEGETHELIQATDVWFSARPRLPNEDLQQRRTLVGNRSRIRGDLDLWSPSQDSATTAKMLHLRLNYLDERRSAKTTDLYKVESIISLNGNDAYSSFDAFGWMLGLIVIVSVALIGGSIESSNTPSSQKGWFYVPGTVALGFLIVVAWLVYGVVGAAQ